MQENHIKPAVVLWITFPDRSATADGGGRGQEAAQNLTLAGIPVIVSAAFSALSASSQVDDAELCSSSSKNIGSTLSVSAIDANNVIAAGAPCSHKRLIQLLVESLENELTSRWGLAKVTNEACAFSPQGISCCRVKAVSCTQRSQSNCAIIHCAAIIERILAQHGTMLQVT
jgi:hypothetical protein